MQQRKTPANTGTERESFGIPFLFYEVRSFLVFCFASPSNYGTMGQETCREGAEQE